MASPARRPDPRPMRAGRRLGVYRRQNRSQRLTEAQRRRWLKQCYRLGVLARS